MTTSDFRFEVEESFQIRGRGTAVVGRIVAGEVSSGGSLTLDTGDAIWFIEHASVESMLREGRDRFALLLSGFQGPVPAGSALISSGD